jgi:hypothetical protein
MGSVIGAVIVAPFLVGLILGNVLSRKRQNPQANQSHSDKLDYPSDTNHETSIAALARAHVAFAKDSDTADKHKSAYNKRTYRVNLWTAIGVCIYTVFTAVIVCFNVAQYWLASGQLEVAQQALVMSQRPWLYIKGDINFIGPGTFAGPTRITLSANIQNVGNAIATDVEMNGKIGSRATRGLSLHNPIDVNNIPCKLPQDTLGVTQTVAVAPKRYQLNPFIVTYTDLISLTKSREGFPYLFGCIKYNWPFTREIFKTYFSAPIDVIDPKTNKSYGMQVPESIDGGITVGKVTYIDAR